MNRLVFSITILGHTQFYSLLNENILTVLTSCHKLIYLTLNTRSLVFYGWIMERAEFASVQGWYNTLPGFKGLMGARNTRTSLSPLHSEVEALIWEMESMRNLRQYHVTFATDCIQLVKMVSAPKDWPEFANHLDDIKILQESFTHSEIIHISRTLNTNANNLARSSRKQTFFVVHMDGCRVTNLVCRVYIEYI